jgi:hypothetical protein
MFSTKVFYKKQSYEHHTSSINEAKKKLYFDTNSLLKGNNITEFPIYEM